MIDFSKSSLHCLLWVETYRCCQVIFLHASQKDVGCCHQYWVYFMTECDVLYSQDGGLLVHVMGHFRVGGSGPLALGPQGAGPDSLFSEVFLIHRDKQGRPSIRNQLFRLL